MLSKVFGSNRLPGVKLHLQIAREMHMNANRSRNLLLTDHSRLHYVEFVAFDTVD